MESSIAIIILRNKQYYRIVTVLTRVYTSYAHPRAA